MSQDAAARRDDVWKRVDAIVDVALLSELDQAVDDHLDKELEDESGDAALAEANLAKSTLPYCRSILRGESCPFGEKCKFQHFAANPKGLAPPSTDLLEREALTCTLCQTLFRTPVTLPCGHTFDRDCLQRLSTQLCPLDQLPFSLPLPEVDFTLRSYIDCRFQQPLPDSRPQPDNIASAQEVVPERSEEAACPSMRGEVTSRLAGEMAAATNDIKLVSTDADLKANSAVLIGTCVWLLPLLVVVWAVLVSGWIFGK